jgi:hypothetical protein
MGCISIFHSCCGILAPLRRPSCEFSKAAFVTNLNAEVIAPDAANPAKKDNKQNKINQCATFASQNQNVFLIVFKRNIIVSQYLVELWTHKGKVSNHPTLNMTISDTKNSSNDTYTNKGCNSASPRSRNI